MDQRRRAFLDDLLATTGPSGYEDRVQSVWTDAVEPIADRVETDAYGNAVATIDNGGPLLAIVGHADEIGYIVRDVTDDGFLRIDRIGGADSTVSRGQHVTVETAGGPIPGVIGQTAIHLRDADDDGVPDIDEQHVDIGASDGDEASELVDRGDPVVIDQRVRELAGTRLAARGLDNRVGVWTAAETLRAAADRDLDVSVAAVSTVQEELGIKGAAMVGFDLDPDAAIAVDVTHATDQPVSPADRSNGIDLGDGPVVTRGSSNHPALVEAVRSTADAIDQSVQLQAAGIRTGTDADAFYTARGGIPALNVGLPNRYMHTPVEVIDTTDLVAIPELLATTAERAGERLPIERPGR
ncbi:zinc-binding metallopeptidase family protein [Halococcoides cellulosivorans]|uniref:Endoglucanase n=1 Tax=Halococcoides cellulosivorans TaxID=1679096 RepID=A0A2R4X077_9EURY|nr:M42 family peptidase [Halococcoides cellulosivorans]AWB27179.1 endoglucanase [Halococcoides cellulosivorans]